MKTTLKIWLIALVVAIGRPVIAAESGGDPPAALVNVVLVEVDTAPEAVAAKRFETSSWEFWDKAAPRLLARLEGELGRSRVTSPTEDPSLYGVRCAAVSLSDKTSLEPLAAYLDTISDITWRPSLLVLWIPNETSVLLGTVRAEKYQAAYALAALASIQPVSSEQQLRGGAPSVSPPCAVTHISLGQYAGHKPMVLDQLLNDSGITTISHTLVVEDYQEIANPYFGNSSVQLPPGAAMELKVVQKNLDRFNNVVGLIEKATGVEAPFAMKAARSLAGPLAGDIKAAGQGNFRLQTSESLERLAKITVTGFGEFTAALEAKGKLPIGYTERLAPWLAGLPKIVEAGASQIGRGSFQPTLREVTLYTDGIFKGAAGMLGGYFGAVAAAPGGPGAMSVGAQRGAFIASSAAEFASDVGRGITYWRFERAALGPVQGQIINNYSTYAQASLAHAPNEPIKSFTDFVGGPAEAKRFAFSSEQQTVLNDLSHNWETLRSRVNFNESQPKMPNAPAIVIDKPRPPEISSLKKPDIYQPAAIPPPRQPPTPAVIGGDDRFRGSGGSVVPGRGPSGGGGFSDSDKFRLAQMGPSPFRSDYNDRLSRVIAAPDLKFKSVMYTPKPGGILFHPELVIVVDESGLAAATAEAVLAAAAGKAEGEVRIGTNSVLMYGVAPDSGNEFTAAAGWFRLNQQDLCVRSPGGADLVLNRYYDSGSADKSALGKGWTFQPFSMRIGDTAKATKANIAFAKRPVLIDNERGAEMPYQVENRAGSPVASSAGTDLPQYKPVKSSYQPFLAAETNGGYTATFAHGLRVAFNSDGRLEWMGMSESNRTDYVYESGRLAKVVGSAGTISLRYDQSGLLCEAVAPDGKRVTYVVKDSLGLTEVSGGVGGSFAFDYANGGRVAKVESVDEAGKRSLVIQNSYDSKGRMLTQKTPVGIWKLRYDDEVGVAVFTDPAGKDVSYYYDGKQQLLAYGSSRKDMTLFNYDVAGRIFQVAIGELLNEPSGSDRPKFKITKMVTQEIPTPEKPAGSG